MTKTIRTLERIIDALYWQVLTFILWKVSCWMLHQHLLVPNKIRLISCTRIFVLIGIILHVSESKGLKNALSENFHFFLLALRHYLVVLKVSINLRWVRAWVRTVYCYPCSPTLYHSCRTLRIYSWGIPTGRYMMDIVVGIGNAHCYVIYTTTGQCCTATHCGQTNDNMVKLL